MDEVGLLSLSPGPHSSARPRRGAQPAPNLLEHEQPDAPNRVWACDLTQLKVGGGMMHAVFIIDLYSRLIVGWGLSNTGDTELCLTALGRACRKHGCPAIFHSDKGSQFTSLRFMAEQRKRRIRQSMTGPPRPEGQRLCRTFHLVHQERMEQTALVGLRFAGPTPNH